MATCQPSWLRTFGGNTDTNLSTLAVFDDGNGQALYAGGNFTNAFGVPANNIAKWNGSNWSALGSGLDLFVDALAVFDDGSGPALYVGGEFTHAGGVAANGIAKWNGSSWSALGSGTNARVLALTTFDDGSGPALYAGGYFHMAGSVAVNNIAKWDGSSWSALGTGIGGQSSDAVRALSVFDDGGGPALYAGGIFGIAGGVAANNIAKWNGTSWSGLGSGMSGGSPSAVFALTVFTLGSATALYAGGEFSLAGGISAHNIARWNGSSWSHLGGGVGGVLPAVLDLTAFDDGNGPALYVGGQFTTAGGMTAIEIAQWNGSSWSSMESGMNGYVGAVEAFDDGRGPALYAAGDFGASASGDSHLAKWGNSPGCGMPGSSTCEPGTGAVIACPCANAPAIGGVGCNNSANTGGARLDATGIARLSYDTVVFITDGEKPTATSIVLQGDSLSSTGVAFGQGVRCVTGALKRLYVKNAVAGSITAPQGADLPVHARSAQLGDTIAPGSHRYYGVYYRDPTVLGSCPASSTFNITQQLDVLWGA
jgi:hypothetical protein